MCVLVCIGMLYMFIFVEIYFEVLSMLVSLFTLEIFWYDSARAYQKALKEDPKSCLDFGLLVSTNAQERPPVVSATPRR